ncbi:hypothetical protein BS78_06G173000 [Paspalum vaginatum]|nr:hypothetical protein BS78_06G173000 [Paspalum vaginatum]
MRSAARTHLHPGMLRVLAVSVPFPDTAHGESQVSPRDRSRCWSGSPTATTVFFKKQRERERLVTVRVEVPGHVGREFVLPASLLGRPRLAPLVAEAEAEYGVQRGDVVRVPCRPCHFVDAMVWAAVEEAMQGGTAIVPRSIASLAPATTAAILAGI